MIPIKQLNQFLEYVDKNLVIGIGITHNEVESMIVFYERGTSDAIHSIQSTTQLILRFRKRLISLPLDSFLAKMKEFEHDFCINHSGIEEYSFFDYLDDQLDKLVKE